VTTNHPKSGYTLYAAIFQPRDETAPNPALAEQAARFPRKSYTDQLRLVLVQYHQQAADILRHSNVHAAAEQAEAARKLAADLATRWSQCVCSGDGAAAPHDNSETRSVPPAVARSVKVIAERVAREHHAHPLREPT